MLSASAVRQRVATAILSAMAATGWQESLVLWDQFPGSSGDNLAHQSFAVGLPRTRVHQDQRQRPTEGALVTSSIGVKWAWNVAALDQLTSYDAALDAEAAIIVAIMTQAHSTDLHLVLEDVTRTVDDQGWMLGSIAVRALHQLALV